MKFAKSKPMRKIIVASAMASVCSLYWSSAHADMGKYQQCRKQAFTNVALSSKTPFFVLNLAVEMNQCDKYLTPVELRQAEKERVLDNFS